MEMKNGILYLDSRDRIPCDYIGCVSSTSSHSKAWVKNGQFHRLDGPALIHDNGLEEWWIDGNQLTAEEAFEIMPNEEKIKVLWELDIWFQKTQIQTLEFLLEPFEFSFAP